MSSETCVVGVRPRIRIRFGNSLSNRINCMLKSFELHKLIFGSSLNVFIPHRRGLQRRQFQNKNIDKKYPIPNWFDKWQLVRLGLVSFERQLYQKFLTFVCVNIHPRMINSLENVPIHFTFTWKNRFSGGNKCRSAIKKNPVSHPKPSKRFESQHEMPLILLCTQRRTERAETHTHKARASEMRMRIIFPFMVHGTRQIVLLHICTMVMMLYVEIGEKAKSK